MILDDNDLVIIQTPIKANQLKLNKSPCIRCCHKMNKLLSDLKFYSGALQLFVSIFVLSLIGLNVHLVYGSCSSNNGAFHSRLKKCNYSIMFFTLFINNFLTGVFYLYDSYQYRSEGYRPNSYFLMFMIWSGGWMFFWPLFVLKKFKSFSEYKLSSIIMTFLSITGPIFYEFSNSIFR